MGLRRHPGQPHSGALRVPTVPRVAYRVEVMAAGDWRGPAAERRRQQHRRRHKTRRKTRPTPDRSGRLPKHWKLIPVALIGLILAFAALAVVAAFFGTPVTDPPPPRTSTAPHRTSPGRTRRSRCGGASPLSSCRASASN
jgi:hypothetical protein